MLSNLGGMRKPVFGLGEKIGLEAFLGGGGRGDRVQIIENKN